ncbi:MAG TPA: hypothetical protein VE818_00720 [Nitrososphaeraceae archaeon]|jgi:hypothetical protein|nr:hypothetical protein [Nitrososphaeraceae archaeon]
MSIDYEFLYAFTKDLLKVDKTITWIGIANNFGVLLNVEYRRGLIPLLTEEENEEYASSTITRHKTRIKFESKIGKLIYALGRYQKLNRVTIPINENYYLLIALDAEVKDFDSTIMEKIIPLIKKEKHNFGDSNTIEHK